MKTKKNSLKLWIAVFLIVFVGLYIFIYVIPRVSDIFIDTYTAEYGTIQIGEETRYFIVRDERVYTAENSGKVDQVADEGELLRASTRVAAVGGTAYYAQERGLVSYYTDGLEEKYNSTTMATVSEAIYDSIASSMDKEDGFKVRKCPSDSAEKGDAIFKIVDNKAWYVVCWLEKKDAENLTEGKNVTFRFEDGSELPMKVDSVSDLQGKKQVILSCNRTYDKALQDRIGSGKLITSNKSGIILETDSIIEVEGQKGVYIVNKLGNNVFTPVKVIATQGDKTVVEKNSYYDDEGNYTPTVASYATILRVKPEEEKGDENVN